MPHSERPSNADRASIDWRGWIVLAWVLGCGLLYGKMVLEQRGQKLGALFTHAKSR